VLVKTGTEVAMRKRIITLIVIILVLSFSWYSKGLAVEVPPTGNPTYIQTNGPIAIGGTNTALMLGDWYTAAAGGNTYHYLTVYIGCSWPTSTPIYFDLYSPEMNSNSTLSDEIDNGGNGIYDNTIFEIYGPTTASITPAPGAPGSLSSQTFIPSNAAESWMRFYTLSPVTCGRYIIRAQTLIDDQNGWRLRVGADGDADPNNAPPANYDNPDGTAGTNDEIVIGMAQTSYQHDVASGPVPPLTNLQLSCITLYQYVNPGQASVTFHNFDLDQTAAISYLVPGRVRYYAPSDTYDATGTTGGTAGSLSDQAVWNNGGTASTRVGDTINNPESGWWRIVTCVYTHNQYIQEGQQGIPTFYEQPPTPHMTLTKSDGVANAPAGQLLTYVLSFANDSNATSTPGAATNVVLRDTIPANTTYQSCQVNAPYSGSCSESGGIVTFTLDQAVNAGANGTVQVNVQVNANPTSNLVNNATLDYSDLLNNLFTQTASDTDTITDFDDLPVSYGSASHTIGGITLGTGVDGDASDQNDVNALGDDSDGNDDDDGVAPTGTWTTSGQVNVTASGSGFLNAWIDFNNDGDFGDTGEQIFTDIPVVAGSQPLTFSIPPGGEVYNHQVYTRFRITTNAGTATSPTGTAPNGEVEGYRWGFGPTAVTNQSLQARSAGSKSFWLAFGLVGIALLVGTLWWRKERTT
jgi:uncharacterized repeat protein (TIGR01451 family)